MTPNKYFLSIDEASHYLGICKTYVRNEIRKGKLKKTSYGKRTLIAVEDANAWAENLRNVGA